MKDDAIERIKSCMYLESACSDVYHLAALNFPAEGMLWNELALDEESHAAVLSAALGKVGGYKSFSVPDGMMCLKRAMDYANDIKQMLMNNALSLSETLRSVKTLLELKRESYAVDLIGAESEERLKKIFERFCEQDRPDLNIVRAVMAKYGLK